MATQTTPICPRCGQLDAARKVTSIVSEGTSVGQYQSIAPVQWQGKTYWLPAQRSATSSTVLVQRLAPPSEPKKPRRYFRGYRKETPWWVLIFYSILGFVSLAIAIALTASSDSLLMLCGVWFAILLVTSMLFVFVPPFKQVYLAIKGTERSVSEAQNQQYQAELWLYEHYPTAINRWRRLYYCGRDDGVFIPGENRFVPIDEMYFYLYE